MEKLEIMIKLANERNIDQASNFFVMGGFALLCNLSPLPLNTLSDPQLRTCHPVSAGNVANQTAS